MKTVVMLSAVLLMNCGDNLLAPEVQRCEDAALDTCDRIGYSGSSYCYLAFAQECSEEDAVAARELCESGPAPSDPCILVWR